VKTGEVVAMTLSDGELRGRTAIGSDGKAIGEVVAILFDNESWSVTGLRVRLRGNVAGEIGVGHSLFRPGTVDVPISQVQSASDAVVLTIPASGLTEHAAQH
jgi:sporulation protein YlmC with PRC-barrel domain